MFGGHTDPEEVKRFAYYLIGTALTVACFIPGSAVVQGIVSLTASAVNVGMALDLMVTSVKDGEAPKLSGTLWFIGSVISGVVNALKLGNAIKFDVNAKKILTSLDDGANITVYTGTASVDPTGGVAIQTKSLNQLPENVQKAYRGYSGNGWSGNYSGQVNPCVTTANAGKIYRNEDRLLPLITSYKEFDVNAVAIGAARDAERFVRGSNGYVYYTSDHYKTFIRIQ